MYPVTLIGTCPSNELGVRVDQRLSPSRLRGRLPQVFHAVKIALSTHVGRLFSKTRCATSTQVIDRGHLLWFIRFEAVVQENIARIPGISRSDVKERAGEIAFDQQSSCVRTRFDHVIDACIGEQFFELQRIPKTAGHVNKVKFDFAKIRGFAAH